MAIVGAGSGAVDCLAIRTRVCSLSRGSVAIVERVSSPLARYDGHAEWYNEAFSPHAGIEGAGRLEELLRARRPLRRQPTSDRISWSLPR